MNRSLTFLLLTLGPGMALAQSEAHPRILPRQAGSAPAPETVTDWPARIAQHDPGSRHEAWAQTEFDDAKWKTMKLPAHWEEAGLPGYDGVVWFRRSVKVPAPFTEQDAVLSLGAIDDMDVTWVNGVRVGGHEQAGDHFTPRRYELKKGILKEGRNVIAVRVMDHGYGGGMAQTHGKMELTAGEVSLPLSGEWRYQPGPSLARLLHPSGADSQDPSRPDPWPDRFELRPHDVLAFAGGTNMVKQFEAGYLEARLTALTPHPVYFRDLAWQADTVYLQQRPRNFGSHLDLLHRMQASVVLCNFGQMEALDGASKLPGFLAAYDRLLDEFAQRTPRLVLIGPHRFEKPANPLRPDLTRHNGDLQAYHEGIRQLAQRRGLLFVDATALGPSENTADGIHLHDSGQRSWARLVAAQLTATPASQAQSPADGLVELIQRKNVLWRQHWRPTNWSFLYGDRQHVPSSHDHRANKPRWFPEEVNAIIPLIEAAEAEIQKAKEVKP